MRILYIFDYNDSNQKAEEACDGSAEIEGRHAGGRRTARNEHLHRIQRHECE